MLKYIKGGNLLITTIMIVAILIMIVVLILTVGTTSKAYQFKHTIDPPPIEDEIMKKQEEST